MKELNLWVEKKYKNLRDKYLKSRMWFILLNVFSFLMMSLMIIVNVYAIKKNVYFRNVVPLYVAISILTGFIALITSILSFFTLNKNSNNYKNQYKLINQEYKMYKSNEGKYSVKSKDEILVDSVLEIIQDNK